MLKRFIKGYIVYSQISLLILATISFAFIINASFVSGIQPGQPLESDPLGAAARRLSSINAVADPLASDTWSRIADRMAQQAGSAGSGAGVGGTTTPPPATTTPPRNTGWEGILPSNWFAQGTWGDVIASGAQWAGIAYMAGQWIGPMLGMRQETTDAFSAGLAAG